MGSYVELKNNGAVWSYIRSFGESELALILSNYVQEDYAGKLTDDLIELEYEVGLYSEHAYFIIGELLEFMAIEGTLSDEIMEIYQTNFVDMGEVCVEEFGIRVFEELRSR